MRYTLTSLKKRTRIFLICAFSVFAALSGRLVYIQLVQGTRLQLLAAEQWYRDLPLIAKRGDIIDTNGTVLAQSTLTYSVYVRPVAVTNAERVAECLSIHLGMNYQNLYERASNRRVSEWLIKMQVEKDTAMKIVAENIDGIFISQSYRRHYPLGATGGQVLGLVSVDSQGQEGIEAYYNKILRGTDGRIAVESDLRGVPKDDGKVYYVASVDGLDLCLNVDAAIQKIVQDAISKCYFEQGAKQVSALVLDIETGGVVASAAAPFYDMNDQPRDDALELLTLIKNSPMINVLEPGSTFKIITIAIALELGLATEADTFNCPGHRIIGGERVKCWRTRGHGMQTLAEGVQNSCNCVFMDLSQRIGVDKYYEYLKKLGIGRKTGVDFYGEPSGLVLDKKWVRPVDLARIAFGQAIAVSPVQFQNTVSAILGDGVLKTPRLAKEFQKNGRTVTTADAVISTPTRGKIISESTSQRVRDLLFGVVANGSGKHAGVSGYEIGGKTGTAQKYKDGIIDQGHYVSSFIGYLAANGRPKYTVMLLVDEPSRNGYYGSIVAAPYVGQIFRGMIDYLKLPADAKFENKNKTAPLVELPSLAGLDLIAAESKLRALGFYVEIEGEGAAATGTFPAAGSMLKYGEPVVICTE